MKNTNHKLCIALCFGLFSAIAQPSSIDNIYDADKKTAEISLIDGPEDPGIQNDGRKNFLTSNISASGETTSVFNAQVKVYPAPFSGIVSVDLSNCPDAKICLYYESGKCIKYQDCENETTAVFNLKDEPKGLYFMEIVSYGRKTVKKIELE
jgi:hypothetical protein